jgi:hypothetical protein
MWRKESRAASGDHLISPDSGRSMAIPVTDGGTREGPRREKIKRLEDCRGGQSVPNCVLFQSSIYAVAMQHMI